MIPLPSGVRVWLAVGRTDMRKGMNGLALQVQQALGRDPHAGDLYVFRGARGDLVKILWHDGIGMSLYTRSTSPARASVVDADGLVTMPIGQTVPGRCYYHCISCVRVSSLTCSPLPLDYGRRAACLRCRTRQRSVGGPPRLTVSPVQSSDF